MKRPSQKRFKTWIINSDQEAVITKLVSATDAARSSDVQGHPRSFSIETATKE